MKVTNIWDVLTKFVLFLLFVAAGVMIFFWYLPLILQNQRMRRDLLVLYNEIRAGERLEKTLVEAQLLIEKYRKEGVPIQF